MLFRLNPLRILLVMSLGGMMACSSNPSAPGGSGGASKADTTRRALKILPDSSTATIRTLAHFTLSSSPSLPKRYSIAWSFDLAQVVRTNTDSVSYTFTTVGKHTLRAVYIDSTGSRRDSATSIITIVDTVSPLSGGLGAFNITVNGEAFDRGTVPMFCTATATFSHFLFNGSPGDRMQLGLDYSRTQYNLTGDVHLAFWVRLNNLMPSTYTLTTYGDDNGAYAQLMKDSKEFFSLPGGSFTITSFDTVHNTISGTYSMVLQDAGGLSVFDTVKGSFTNVCFNVGLFGQGLYTANAGPLTIQQDGPKNFFISEYIPPVDRLQLESVQNDSSRQVLRIWITSPRVGTFPVAWPPRPGTAYFEYSAGLDFYSTMSGGPGSVTITAFDTVTRRVSGTFYVTTHMQTGGKKMDVTNGVIDNVMWGRD
ncbi:MAG: DUF6252 family protein [Bacteroidota bacterium]|nr:DUF6252 family protein [Bacteroidota bacterium]MDP4233433.1 DUF6252 family protein [Bacteroidota bacterium]MDP4242299.1 DUF6252 family protein [Bacteroidota bacterium]MDP4287055.1 DUF6252 family protein [Bacteroidota bacterium]